MRNFFLVFLICILLIPLTSSYTYSDNQQGYLYNTQQPQQQVINYNTTINQINGTFNVTSNYSNYSNFSAYSNFSILTDFWDNIDTPLDFVDAIFSNEIQIGNASTKINGTRITTEELFADNICYSDGTNCISNGGNYINGSGNGSIYGGYISKFTALRTIADSQIWDDSYSVKIGTQEGSEKFIVNGSTRVTNLNTSGFIMPTGANNDYCLKTDENGTGSWQSCASGLSGGQIFHLPIWTGAYTIGNSRFVEQTDGIVGIASDNSSEPIPFVFRINSTDGHTVIGEGANWNERYLLTTQKTIGNSPDEFVGIFNRIALNLTANSSQDINGIISMIDYSQDYTLNGMIVSSANAIFNNGNGTIGSEDNPIFATIGGIENNQFGYIPLGIGSLGMIRNTGSGKIDTGIGLSGWIDNSGNGNITNAISILAGQVDNSGNGNIENAYGLVIADQSGIGSIDSINLYSEGNNSINIFEGNIDIRGNITAQGNQGLTVNKLILKDVNLVSLIKTYCWLNFSVGLLTSSDC